MKRSSKEFFEYYHKVRWTFEGTYAERQEQEEKLIADWYHEMEVGDHAHVTLWSDIEPVTIIKKTATTLTVRYDEATLDPDWKPEFVLGGFCAHCTNNDEQRWFFRENPNGRTETFRWSKSMNCYQHNGCKLRPGWRKHYDYNF